MSLTDKDKKDLIKIKQEEYIKRLKKYTSLEGHRAPVTRREFLASGLIKISASVAIPSLGTFLTGLRQAEAAPSCPSSAQVNLPAYIGVNLAGGSSLPAQLLPLAQDKKSLLPAYNYIGAGSRPSTVQAFGGVWNTNGQLYAGLNQTLTATAKQKLSVCNICVIGRDDSGDNELDISGMITAAGLVGRALPNMGRSSRFVSGNNNRSAHIQPPNPMIIRNLNQAGAALPQGVLPNLNDQQKSILFQTISKMNDAQKLKLQSVSGGAMLANLLDCAGIRNQEILKAVKPEDINPRLNAQINNIWQLEGKPDNSEDAIAATLAYNALNGIAGTANLDIGQHDYHGPPRSEGDAIDLAAGITLGRIINSAEALNRKLFLYISTDGSMGTEGGSDPFTPYVTDRGTGATLMFFVFDPAGKPAMRMNQIGWFDNTQQVDTGFKFAKNIPSVAAGVFLNYLQFAGQIGKWDSIFKERTPFATSDFADVLAVG